MTNVRKWAGIAAGVLTIGILLGMWLGWKLWKPKAPKPETYAASAVQKDGSRVLERKPQADAKPAQQIPKGAVVERIIQEQFQPTVATDPTNGSNLGTLPVVPHPYTLDLTLVRMTDGSRRVIGSSPDGTITGGVDIPVEPVSTPRDTPWAAGVVYGTTTAWGDKSVGAFVDRDFAFLRVGLEITKNTYAMQATCALTPRSGWEVRAKIGIKF